MQKYQMTPIQVWVKRLEKPVAYLGNLVAIASFFGAATVWLVANSEHWISGALCLALLALLIDQFRLYLMRQKIQNIEQAFTLLYTRESQRLAEQIQRKGLPLDNLAFAAALGQISASHPKQVEELLELLEQARTAR